MSRRPQSCCRARLTCGTSCLQASPRVTLDESWDSRNNGRSQHSCRKRARHCSCTVRVRVGSSRDELTNGEFSPNVQLTGDSSHEQTRNEPSAKESQRKQCRRL